MNKKWNRTILVSCWRQYCYWKPQMAWHLFFSNFGKVKENLIFVGEQIFSACHKKECLRDFLILWSIQMKTSTNGKRKIRPQKGLEQYLWYRIKLIIFKLWSLIVFLAQTFWGKNSSKGQNFYLFFYYEVTSFF